MKYFSFRMIVAGAYQFISGRDSQTNALTHFAIPLSFCVSGVAMSYHYRWHSPKP